DIPQDIDPNYGRYELAKNGNDAATQALIAKAETDTQALEYLGSLASPENSQVISALGKLAQSHHEALNDLCKAALKGSDAAIPLLMKAANTDSNRVYATLHKLVHQQKRAGAIEAVKDLEVSKLPYRPDEISWLVLFSQCGNENALEKLATTARTSPEALGALHYLVLFGSEPAIQKLSSLAKVNPNRIFAYFYEFVHRDKRPAAIEAMKNFKITDLPDPRATVQ